MSERCHVLPTVKMKGRVGCQMGYREMLVTELVFHDVLTAREPPEIAALLSAIVFEQKRCSAPNLTPGLQKVSAAQQTSDDLTLLPSTPSLPVSVCHAP